MIGGFNTFCIICQSYQIISLISLNQNHNLRHCVYLHSHVHLLTHNIFEIVFILPKGCLFTAIALPRQTRSTPPTYALHCSIYVFAIVQTILTQHLIFYYNAQMYTFNIVLKHSPISRLHLLPLANIDRNALHMGINSIKCKLIYVNIYTPPYSRQYEYSCASVWQVFARFCNYSRNSISYDLALLQQRMLQQYLISIEYCLYLCVCYSMSNCNMLYPFVGFLMFVNITGADSTIELSPLYCLLCAASALCYYTHPNLHIILYVNQVCLYNVRTKYIQNNAMSTSYVEYYVLYLPRRVLHIPFKHIFIHIQQDSRIQLHMIEHKIATVLFVIHAACSTAR